MLPPRIPAISRPVQLKHSVDLQLERAFHDQDWTIAANLARQRHKTTKDEYYKRVEVAAKSRGDIPADRTIGIEVVQAMVSDNTIINDVDALDLYEFSVSGLSLDYSKTIGILRARLVKALPKDQGAGIRCLEACMWHSDWENAQEVAVSLNKNFPGDRRFLFQNILTMFLVAVDENVNENKRKLFANLAKAQVDRAFNLRPLIGKDQTPIDQSTFGENEVKLWIKIREKCGLSQENLKLLTMPNWGPLFFLEKGFTDAFLRSMQLLAFNSHWAEIIRVVNTIFDKVIALEEKSEDKKDDGGAADSSSDSISKEHYVNASREWSVWKTATIAAKHLPNGQGALDVFHGKLQRVVNVLTSRRRMNPIFQQNYDQILTEITFNRAAIVPQGLQNKSENKKISHLLELAKKAVKGSSSFTTIKGYLELLTAEEVADFVNALESEHNVEISTADNFNILLMTTLRLMVKFFQATSLTDGEKCRFCYSVASQGADCNTCLKSIAGRALEAFSKGVRDQDISEKASNATEDPLSNLAILGSICLVKLAGAGCQTRQYMTVSPLYPLDIQLFLQAVIWLDFYLRKTPRNDSLRLLLVKLYLMMGCVTRALDIWSLFDVKNTLLECLGTVCLDRLASVSPGPFISGPVPLSFANLYLYTRHFETAIQKRYPDTVMKTLQNGSYAELPDVIQLAENQSRNCVSVLAVIESRRGRRLRNGRNEVATKDEPLIGSLSPEYELHDFTDYNPLPHWAGPRSIPIEELVTCGPLPTNRRCHLNVLSERFLDLVCYAQPKDFKPTKSAQQLLQADWHAANLSFKDLHAHLITLLVEHEVGAKSDLTGAEMWYFTTVMELSKLIILIFETIFLPDSLSSKATAREDTQASIRRILAILDQQVQDFLLPDSGADNGDSAPNTSTLQGVAALHVTGMLRESALAIRGVVAYITRTLESSPTKSREAGPWLSPETKKLITAASAADARMKDRIKKLTSSLQESGWVDRLDGWVFGDDSDDETTAGDEIQTTMTEEEFKKTVAREIAHFVPPEAREVWAMDVAESWRDVLRGWGAVRFE